MVVVGGADAGVGLPASNALAALVSRVMCMRSREGRMFPGGWAGSGGGAVLGIFEYFVNEKRSINQSLRKALRSEAHFLGAPPTP